jgi:predicted metal-dependent hydrolase
MRQIETDMLEAIKQGRNWSKDNTRVEADIVEGVKYTKVFLHNHKIAATAMWKGSLIVETCKDTLRNYPSRTTMGRLRALGVDVFTRKGQVILHGEELCEAW